ncbi:MAG: Gfo/Idh/MocA family protein [Chloroflexota bacterium]|nr:MAG: oxidoreductase [Chloroflexota bacterium]
MKKRRALIAGAGHWSRAWGRELQNCDRVEIAGWVDIRPGAAEDAVQQLGLQNVHTDTNLDRAIAIAKPDFAVNATVPSAHCDVSIQALEAGLPVVSEKPMAESMEQARAMVATSERTGNLLMINQQRRHDAGLVATRRLVEKHIGPLGILTSDFCLGWHESPFMLGMANPLLLDMAIHTFDAARFLSRADPVAVYCDGFNPSWSWFSGDASAVAIFEMTGGLRYIYQGSWCSQGLDTAWEAQWRAVGPQGTVIWDGQTAPEGEIVAEPGVFPATKSRIAAELESDMPTWLAGSLRDFLHALDTGATPMTECHDNIKSLSMVLGALESAATGRRVAIEL